MFTDVLLGALGVMGMASGVSALVYRRNGNGHNGNGNGHPAPEAAPRPVEDWQLAKLSEVIQPLAMLPQRLAAVFEARELPPIVIPPQPELERLTDRLEALIQMGPAPDPSDALRAISARLEELVAEPPPPVVVQWPAEMEDMAQRLEKAIQSVPKNPAPPPAPPRIPTPREGGGATVVSEPSPGPAFAPVDIHLEMFNTFALLPGDIYTLIPPDTGVHQINIANLGPGTIYVRADADPFVDDPYSERLMAGWFDNDIPIPVSLRVLADNAVVIIARLTYQ
ncbi:MAG TPA: hypothetical protein VIX37_04715 [Candidatus Sulfotelmatobacter sp.]